MGNKIYRHICKHYHRYSFVANMLSSISLAGLALIGVISDTMTMAWLIGWAVMFAITYWFGSLLNQEIDDMDKVKEHSCESTCSNKE